MNYLNKFNKIAVFDPHRHNSYKLRIKWLEYVDGKNNFKYRK